MKGRLAGLFVVADTVVPWLFCFALQSGQSVMPRPGRQAMPQAITVPAPPLGALTPAPATANAETIPPAVPAPVATLDAAPAQVTTETLAQVARRSAGAIDRQLRKASWNPRDKVIARDGALVGRLGAAYRGPATYAEERVILPDGRQMTVIHSGGSTYCAAMESNTMVGGRDVFRNGVKTRISSCPY